MKKVDLKNETTEKLKSELKKIKAITGVLAGILTLLFAITIYGLITSENKTTFISLIAVAISCSVILPSQFSNMKKIKTELTARNGEEKVN